MKTLSKVYSKFKKETYLFSFAYICDTSLNLILIHLLSELINAASQLDVSHFSKLTLYFLAGLSLFTLFIIVDQYSFRRLIYCGEIELKKYTYGRFLRNSDKIAGLELGGFVSAINSDTTIISGWLSTGRINTFFQFAILIIYLLLMASYNVIIMILTALLILAVFVVSKVVAEKEAAFVAKQQGVYAKINSALLSNLHNKTLVSQLHNEFFFEEKLRTIHKEAIDDVFKALSKYTALSDALLSFMTNSLPLIVFTLGLLLTKYDAISVGDTIALMLVAQKLNEPIILLADLIADQKKAQEVYTRLAEVYSESSTDCGDDSVEPFEDIQVNIQDYRYSIEGEKLLTGVHFQIRKGDVVLIKGDSGKGKTTLINLIAKLNPFDGLNGTIKYNNKDMIRYNRDEYYRHVLLVEQETVLVDGSILDNILLGDVFPIPSVEKILHVCVLTDLISRKSSDFEIIENGTNISGGERQRIGLARILLRNPDVVILDEITSALDYDTKQVLVKRLVEYAQDNNITIIAVSHDCSFDSYCTERIEL